MPLRITVSNTIPDYDDVCDELIIEDAREWLIRDLIDDEDGVTRGTITIERGVGK